MIADEPRSNSRIGSADSTELEADAFLRSIVGFVERELPLWGVRADRPQVTDEPRLNETLCDHLECAARKSFDLIRFVHEPYQSAGRNADLAVKPSRGISVEGVGYTEFEQLLPIECKRLPTPKDSRRSDCEYVHGLPGRRTGAIERFKEGLHGPDSAQALVIAYVQEETFEHWVAAINGRLSQLAEKGTDEGRWDPVEHLVGQVSEDEVRLCKLESTHRRASNSIQIKHLWLQMN